MSYNPVVAFLSKVVVAVFFRSLVFLVSVESNDLKGEVSLLLCTYILSLCM